MESTELELIKFKIYLFYYLKVELEEEWLTRRMTIGKE